MALVVIALLGLLIGFGLVYLPAKAAFAIPLVMLFLVLGLLFPFILVIFLLGLTPFRILWLAGGISPQELFYSVTFLGFLGFSVLRKFLRKTDPSYPTWNTPVALPIFCMGLLGLWGAAVAVLRGHAFAYWASDLNFILFFWLYFVVAVNFKGPGEIYRVFWPTLWITAGVVVWGFIRRLQAGGLFAGITPGFPRAMAFSSSFFILCLCLFLFSEPGRLRRRGFFWLTVFFGAHQFLSFVRVAWVSQLGTAGFLLLALPLSEKQRYLRWIGVFLVLTAIVVIVAWMLPTDNLLVKAPIHLTNRVMSVFTDTTGSGATMRTRYSEWGAALRKYAEHPFLGNGLGTEIRFVRYDFAKMPVTTERYIHSSYIYYLLNTGPLGLLVFIWFCLSAFRYGLEVYRKLPVSELKGLALGFSAAFVFQIFSSIAGNELNNPSRTIWTGFFLGALTVIDQWARRQGFSEKLK
ncbi:MAG: O-antigen ligase family protein [Candidatus Omnitrophota bacterium]